MRCRLIQYLLICITLENYSFAMQMPNIGDIKSVMKFVAVIQYKFEYDYKLNYASKITTDNSKLHTDMNNLLFDTQKISKKSFEDNLNELLNLFARLEIDNSSLTESPSDRTLYKIKNRFKIIDNFIKYITDTYGQLNNATYLCTFAGNCWEYLSQSNNNILNTLFFRLTTYAVNDLQEYIANNNDTCQIQTSLQRQLNSFMSVVMQKHLQEYILSTYSWALKLQCQNKNFKSWKNMNELIKNGFLSNVRDAIQLMQLTLKKLPIFIYRCDVKEHVRDITYLELERMLQMLIANEYDLTTEKTCTYNCEFPENSLTSYRDDSSCEKIFNCKYLAAYLTICDQKNNARRVEWFRETYGEMYGTNDTSTCPGEKHDVKSYLYWGRMCDYCVCTCRGKKSSDRYTITTAVSFRDQTTSFKDNMVVVGIKFVKKDNMIHVQVKQGKLLPFGMVDARTVAWVPLNDFYYDYEINLPVIHFINETNIPLAYGKDYGHPSIVYLDDVIAPKNCIVTGARFKFIRNWLATSTENQEGTIELQIQVTPFDFTLGKLLDNHQQYWISPELSDNSDQLSASSNGFAPREEVLLEEPDNPIKSEKNIPDSQDNQFIKFRASDLKKDAGQSTLPFFDGQAVEGSPVFPLSGVGLFHKGSKGYGGFLLFKIFDLNLLEYMNAERQ